MAEGLWLRGVGIARDGVPLISVNCRIAPGEVLTVMGPSGIGKSTLLACITGTLPPNFTATGRIQLDGYDITDLPPDRRRVGILFQDDLLFPHLSVGGSRRLRRVRIEAALAEINLPGFADRDPATLSGGQKARVALMRMLLAEPRALLLDEAFSGLDAELRAQMRNLVFSRAKARELAVLLVTHDAEDAHAAGGEVLTLRGMPS